MADWFKLHENWFTEPRLQWAIKEQGTVVQVWLWALTECCRTKSDTIGLHSEDYEMIGIQQLLNISPGLFNQGLNLLGKIKYISIDKELKTIKVLKWNDFQSDYLRKKDHRESDSVRQSPTKSDSVVLEERRGEEIREEEMLQRAMRKPKAKESTPTVEEVALYVKHEGLNVNPEVFWNHYNSTGWVAGGAKIRDWKSKAKNWHHKSRDGSKRDTTDYGKNPTGAFAKP